MLSATGGSQCAFLSGLTLSKTDNHCFCACDCGTAAQLATQYGLTVPSGLSPSAFCIGGITWGVFLRH